MIRPLDTWVGRLEQAHLPALPGTAALVTGLCRDENVRIEQLADRVEGDPGLALHFLRVGNDIKHKHLRAEINTVGHALMMLGLNRLAPIAREIPPVELPPRGTEAPVRKLLKSAARAFHAAYQAWDWARLRQDSEPGEIYAAALLHNLAEMLLWVHAPHLMEEIDRHAEQPYMDREEAEYVFLGFGIDELSLELAKRWGLPSLLQHSLQVENAENNRVWGVMLANELARQVESGWYRPQVYETIAQVAEHLGWEVAQTAARIHSTAALAARMSTVPDTSQAAALLVGNVSADAFEQRPQEEADFCLTPQSDVLEASLERLRAVGGASPLREVIEQALDGMHRGIGLNRAAFTALAADRSCLRPVVVTGVEHDPTFGRLVLQVDENDLLGSLLKKPQALWMNEHNRPTLWHLVPEAFRRTVRTYSFFAMSVFARGRPVGIFYADRRSGPLDATAYEQFKRLAAEATQAMERLGQR